MTFELNQEEMREKLFDYKAQGITSPKTLKQEFSWHLKKKKKELQGARMTGAK